MKITVTHVLKPIPTAVRDRGFGMFKFGMRNEDEI